MPVSSSGHLVFFQSFFGLKGPMLAFDAMLHLGTLMALFIVFRRELGEMVLWGLRRDWSRSEAGAGAGTGWGSPRGMVYFIALGSVPIGIIGYLLKDRVEDLFSSPGAAGLMLMVTGAVLFTTRYASEREPSASGLTAWRALLIGAAQGLAVMPGLSRSGVTISVGLLLGIERWTTAAFSFLLSIPAILGATGLSLPALGGIGSGGLTATLIGTAAAAASGYVSLRIVLRVVRTGRIHRFAPYCLIVGGLMLAM